MNFNLSKNKHILLVLACTSMVVAGFLFWPKPVPPAPQCIQVPELEVAYLRTSALESAALLEKIPIDAKLKASYEEATKTVFQKLPERELAFLILMRSIECYITLADSPEKAVIVSKVLPELLAIARSHWSSSHGLKGGDGELGLSEMELLDHSPYKDEITQVLDRILNLQANPKVQ